MAQAAEKKEDQAPKHPLDVMLEVDEGEITRLAEHPDLATQSQEVTEETVKETPAVEESPAQEQAPQQEPPATGERPPQQTEEKPAEEARETQAPEKKPDPRREYWKEMRELKRANKERERELNEERLAREKVERDLEEERARRRLEAGDIEEAELDDPLAKVNKDLEDIKAKQERTAQQLQETQALNQQRSVEAEIEREEERFRADHPDYHDAVDFLVQTQRDEFEETGILDAVTQEMLERSPEVVEQHMQSTGMDDEYEAAKDVSFRLMVNEQRKAFVAATRKGGRSVAQAAYNLAKKRGYQAQAPATEEETKPQAPKPPTAKERVERAKKLEPATQSLSSMQNKGTPVPAQIRTRQQLLDLDPDEMDKYIVEMDAKDPTWDRNLA